MFNFGIPIIELPKIKVIDHTKNNNVTHDVSTIVRTIKKAKRQTRKDNTRRFVTQFSDMSPMSEGSVPVKRYSNMKLNNYNVVPICKSITTIMTYEQLNLIYEHSGFT